MTFLLLDFFLILSVLLSLLTLNPNFVWPLYVDFLPQRRGQEAGMALRIRKDTFTGVWLASGSEWSVSPRRFFSYLCDHISLPLPYWPRSSYSLLLNAHF